MQAIVVRTRFNKKTEEIIEEKIIEKIEINEESFYEPVVEYLGSNILADKTMKLKTTL
ncbi:hypothetical protein phiCTC2B_04 (endogenous virus) [Clostridium phage phiCTC2B]|uniref:hypothetical protein n=1 Tax=Clostridium phage phiCT453B TaxID=1567013 RepID=UPI0002F5DD32|nr:hypothetical protein [Clostridium tetani]YP_009217900.1 hypothetical protein phiCT453B_04 [Clostridium phage phiCT453B]YP_009276901.1 hypothetical protein phiCT19406B_04 [Clostridium phage phiCT19406B]YP_009277345.1 hypothetical protein phiCTC2B_04 [Clostridium phage phiCTC2B]AJA42556.1 hypothetical protein phiCT453B_04 [Clostridium phage phiCT453B]AJA42761.1 hypothetical protein phiCT19406B_04 [Clostridium phage phiCT19406B]AJA42957.1 hypothetical protein phiCTC2B_04 [Clostridium phage ph